MSISGLNWIAVEKYLFVFGFSVLDFSIVKKQNISIIFVKVSTIIPTAKT